MIADDERDGDEERLLHARIPTRMAIRLHEHRIVTGHPLGRIVNDAIDDYLDRAIGDV